MITAVFFLHQPYHVFSWPVSKERVIYIWITYMKGDFI